VSVRASKTMTFFDISASPPASAMRNRQYLCGCWRTGGAGGYFSFLVVVMVLRLLPFRIIHGISRIPSLPVTRNQPATRNRQCLRGWLRVYGQLRVLENFSGCVPGSLSCIRYIRHKRYELALLNQRGNSVKLVTPQISYIVIHFSGL
jgi:hypothetical protein